MKPRRALIVFLAWNGACDGSLAFDTHTFPGGTAGLGGEAGNASGAGLGGHGLTDAGAGANAGGSGGTRRSPGPCGGRTTASAGEAAAGEREAGEPVEVECIPCTSATDCARPRRWCDPTLSICVECRDASDCPPFHECNPSTRRCH